MLCFLRFKKNLILCISYDRRLQLSLDLNIEQSMVARKDLQDSRGCRKRCRWYLVIITIRLEECILSFDTLKNVVISIRKLKNLTKTLIVAYFS